MTDIIRCKECNIGVLDIFYSSHMNRIHGIPSGNYIPTYQLYPTGIKNQFVKVLTSVTEVNHETIITNLYTAPSENSTFGLCSETEEKNPARGLKTP